MEYFIKKNNCVYSMDFSREAALKVSSLSTVTFDTFDCFQEQITNNAQEIENLNWENINPATGPLYIYGAEKGDILKIEILKIETGNYGVMAAIPGSGLLGNEVKKSEIKIVPIKNGIAEFNEKIHISVKPMIGVIGVAPETGSIPCGSPGSHGGNMDNTRICEGSTLYLPVFTEGGLLSIGDLHACMGDGEIMVTGLETSGSVKIRVEVIKGKNINNPILEDKDYIYTIASDMNLMDAVKTSTRDMHDIIMDRLGLSFNEAGMLLSAAGSVQICQVVDPLLTVRFAFPRNVCESGLKVF